jgi:hypothetical protein
MNEATLPGEVVGKNCDICSTRFEPKSVRISSLCSDMRQGAKGRIYLVWQSFLQDGARSHPPFPHIKKLLAAS